MTAKVSSPGMGASSASQNDAAGGRVGQPLAGGERAGGVVEAFGLDGVDRDPGDVLPQRQGAAGDQPAAAAADQDRVEAARRSAACSASSSPAVPWPAMTSGSS